ncbi:MAG: uracil-DNA glycosylase family protein [Cytophagales bacterium]|nr:MAG: uracil-DNA glycosylase family protein [Cytophagales bacterium]
MERTQAHHQIEIHPFDAFVPQNAKMLILGSFPCNRNLKNTSATQPEYGEWFYLGSGKSNFWRIMENIYEATPNLQQRSAKEALLQQNQIALADIALRIERKQNNCLDTSLRVLEYNTKAIIEILSQQPIEKVACNSRWVEKWYLKNIQPAFLHIPVVYLLSPSPAADASIRRRADFKQFISQNPAKNLLDFRIHYYKERLPTPQNNEIINNFLGI